MIECQHASRFGRQISFGQLAKLKSSLSRSASSLVLSLFYFCHQFASSSKLLIIFRLNSSWPINMRSCLHQMRAPLSCTDMCLSSPPRPLTRPLDRHIFQHQCKLAKRLASAVIDSMERRHALGPALRQLKPQLANWIQGNFALTKSSHSPSRHPRPRLNLDS